MIRCIFLVLILAGILTGGCGEQPAPVQNAGAKTVILYSELDNKFTENLVDAFNKEQKAKLQLKAIYELKPGGELPDVVLAEQRTLAGLKRQGRLKPVAFADGDRLPQKFRDADLSWYGVFYDPIVFLVNQQYARTVGQANICSWQDLAGKEQLRIALENLSDSNSTQNFLAGLADRFGEDESLEYLVSYLTIQPGISSFLALSAKSLGLILKYLPASLTLWNILVVLSSLLIATTIFEAGVLFNLSNTDCTLSL